MKHHKYIIYGGEKLGKGLRTSFYIRCKYCNKLLFNQESFIFKKYHKVDYNFSTESQSNDAINRSYQLFYKDRSTKCDTRVQIVKRSLI